MAKNLFKFPKGTTEISAKEWKDVLCKYEIVDIPGTVGVVSFNCYSYQTAVITRQLVLHEGTRGVYINGRDNISINVPKSLIVIDGCEICVPRVLCLSEDFRVAHHLKGVEYYQAYGTTDNGYFKSSNLKHYVYLGKISQKSCQFYGLSEGCVIHVPTKKLALQVLKRCDVCKHYVVVDADEWKVFPADKLALTMKEYNPESRILPEQQKLREEKEKARAEEARQNQEMQRQRRKKQILEDLSAQVVETVLAPLFGTIERETWKGQVALLPAYRVNISEEKEGADSVLELTAIIEPDIFVDGSNRSLAIVFRMLPPEITDRVDDIAHYFTQIKDFVAKRKEMFCKYKLDFSETDFRNNPYTPGLSLPFQDYNIVAQLSKDSIQDDVEELTKFVTEFSSLIDEARGRFRLGFLVKKWFN